MGLPRRAALSTLWDTGVQIKAPRAAEHQALYDRLKEESANLEVSL